MNHDAVPPPEIPVISRPHVRPSRFARISGWISRRRRLLGITGALLLLAAGVTYALWPKPQPEFRGGRFNGFNAMPVNAGKAELGDIPIDVPALGTVTPLKTVTVRPQVTGYITKVLFKEGQMVHEGDTLATIDPRPYQFSLDQSEGQLARDQAQLRNAELDLERYQNLLAQESIAKQQVDTQTALVRQDRGVVQTDQGAVDNARLNLERTNIKAPLTGRIGLRVVDEGNYIASGDANGIAVITQVQPISVIFTVQDDHLADILKHMRAGDSLKATALDKTTKTELATGVLANVDNRIDITTGTVKMRADFDNKDESLFPNQFVNVVLLVDTLKNVVVVPVSAVQHGAPGTYVWLVGEDNKVSIRPVTIGDGTPDKVAVLNGLAAGDTVVTDGADRLKDGMVVMLPGQAPPQGQFRGRQRNGNGNGGPPRGGPGGGGPRGPAGG